MSGDRLFLVKIATDPRVKHEVQRPVTMVTPYEVVIIPKDPIVCDACNACVDVNDEEASDVTGYALCDPDTIIEVVCDECRRRYFPTTPVYQTLEEALGENDD
ncbi:MAG: hypothetical protein QXS96_07640 [Candidatus Caldarchaeum sp.]